MLKVLPENISNLIAAGEVGTRPASVVKELVENAVDAGSKSVSVVILDAGRTLIQVIDDGCGMTADEALLCFERHATSKISEAEDLERISTFGFRGEALASIAAVAEVTLKTRREEDETGTLVRMAASRLVEQSSVAAPKGSNFEIRNLFYNVPARRKFLKSDNAELKHIVNEFL
ncbi:MAG: ATP-binding protein, partial [Bacteroidales bacterium]|nr:ATP-binding protein [Bacteroidales bacterium]